MHYGLVVLISESVTTIFLKFIKNLYENCVFEKIKIVKNLKYRYFLILTLEYTKSKLSWDVIGLISMLESNISHSCIRGVSNFHIIYSIK